MIYIDIFTTQCFVTDVKAVVTAAVRDVGDRARHRIKSIIRGIPLNGTPCCTNLHPNI